MKAIIGSKEILVKSVTFNLGMINKELKDNKEASMKALGPQGFKDAASKQAKAWHSGYYEGAQKKWAGDLVDYVDEVKMKGKPPVVKIDYIMKCIFQGRVI